MAELPLNVITLQPNCVTVDCTIRTYQFIIIRHVHVCVGTKTMFLFIKVDTHYTLAGVRW